VHWINAGQTTILHSFIRIISKPHFSTFEEYSMSVAVIAALAVFTGILFLLFKQQQKKHSLSRLVLLGFGHYAASACFNDFCGCKTGERRLTGQNFWFNHWRTAFHYGNLCDYRYWYCSCLWPECRRFKKAVLLA